MALVSVTMVNAQSAWDLENQEVWRFPDSMKVADVKKEFGAVGDGKADDTAALQKAIDRRGAFVYLPNGTYLVRDRLRYNQGASVMPSIQGESRDGVIIKLADDAVGFDNPQQPQAVLQLVPGEMKDKLSADYFKTKLRNLTIDTGQHRGAIAVIFYASNNGMMRNVRLVGQGAIGLHLERQLNGPLLVSNVEIDGFAVGIKAGSGPFNSQTLEHIILKNQTRSGIENKDESLSIRGLFSLNKVPAVRTEAGYMVLIDSELKGGDQNQPALICGGRLFVRNVKTEGYGRAIEKHAYERQTGLGTVTETVPAGQVAEWSGVPGTSNFQTSGPVRSLNLPIEEAPYEPLDKNFNNWVCVDDFGAAPNDQGDDTAAVKKAIAYAMEQKKTTLCFRTGTYLLGGSIPIGGSIRRLQGAYSFFRPPAVDQECRFVIVGGSAPIVTFDLIDRALGPKLEINLENASARTLVVRNYRPRFFATGPGKTFLEDACGSIVISNPKAKVWTRQFNTEGARLNENQGGMLWVLGLKTEGVHNRLTTTAGGQSEVLGGWIYVIGKEAPVEPMFTVQNARFGCAGIIQWHSAGKTYKALVDETQGATHKVLTKETNGGRDGLPLFSTR
jgi:hypothetical protein